MSRPGNDLRVGGGRPAAEIRSPARRLLRARHERSNHRAAEQRDEFGA